MVSVLESDGVAEQPRHVAVIGAGYVGSPTAVLLAHFGHSVVVAERDDQRRQSLEKGQSPMVEEGLEELLVRTQESGRLRFVAQAIEAVRDAQFVFLCVATPLGDDGRADLTDVDAVVEEIRAHLRDDAIVINKSTVPVGTGERVAAHLSRPSIRVVSNPEFLREGSAVRDSFNPDRVVVGSSDHDAALAVSELFAPTGAPVVVTDTRTAELVKYAANAYLVTKLSFVNTMVELCDAVGADVADLVTGVGHDDRIGFSFFSPGPGWGGSCLPKDTAALLSIADDAKVELPLVRAAVTANVRQMSYVAQRAQELLGGSLRQRRVGVWGLTFKAKTGDRRESPALNVVRHLVNAGAVVAAYDPTVAVDDHSDDLGDVNVVATAQDAARDADLVILLTEWPQFAAIDLATLAATMSTPMIFDTRGLIDPDAARAAGMRVVSLGRPA